MTIVDLARIPLIGHSTDRPNVAYEFNRLVIAGSIYWAYQKRFAASQWTGYRSPIPKRNVTRKASPYRCLLNIACRSNNSSIQAARSPKGRLMLRAWAGRWLLLAQALTR